MVSKGIIARPSGSHNYRNLQRLCAGIFCYVGQVFRIQSMTFSSHLTHCSGECLCVNIDMLLAMNLNIVLTVKTNHQVARLTTT